MAAQVARTSRGANDLTELADFMRQRMTQLGMAGSDADPGENSGVRELARRSGLHPQTISYYLRGMRQPKRDAIEKLAAALNVDSDRLAEIASRDRYQTRSLGPMDHLQAFVASKDDLSEQERRDALKILLEQMKDLGPYEA